MPKKIEITYELPNKKVTPWVSGIGFQFGVLNEKNQAISSTYTCKDYLQDTFWGLYTQGKSTWLFEQLNLESRMFKFCLISKDIKDRIDYLRKFVRTFEDALGIPHSRFLLTADDGKIIVKFSRVWTSNPLLLSSFTTILRIAGAYKGEEPLKYLSGLKKEGCGKYPNYMYADVQRLNLKRFNALLKGIRPQLKWEELGGSFYDSLSVHGTGMVMYKDFPEVELD